MSRLLPFKSAHRTPRLVPARLRALNKKLREIEDLQKRAANGVPLDEQQQQKLASLGPTLAEMEKLGV